MTDPRLVKLADNLVCYSCDVQKGEKVLIEAIGIDSALVEVLMGKIYERGGVPYLWRKDNRDHRAWLMGVDEAQLNFIAAHDAALMRQMQCYIGVRSGENAFELSDVPQDKMELYNRLYWKEVHGKIRVPDTRWVVLRYPNGAMAQMAAMSTAAFEGHYFNVCNLDYAKMSRAMDALVARMEKTDRVRITGADTDLRFSIKGIPAIKCDGKLNIPDGEVYTAPVKESVEGTIHYNVPTLEGGYRFTDVRLTFKKGKIVEATSNNNERINKIFDTDEGARYAGEFAIGVNPYINEAIQDTLFDEKIAGSIHFTPGAAYDDAFNGNKSAVHWDMVFIQTPEYGGGEIWFDDELIRKDGRFVPESLHCLNPENLK